MKFQRNFSERIITESDVETQREIFLTTWCPQITVHLGLRFTFEKNKLGVVDEIAIVEFVLLKYFDFFCDCFNVSSKTDEISLRIIQSYLWMIGNDDVIVHGAFGRYSLILVRSPLIRVPRGRTILQI